MKGIKSTLIAFTLLFSTLTFAEVIVDVGIVHKKYIDSNFYLKNELYSIENFSGSRELVITMQSGLKVVMNGVETDEVAIFSGEVFTPDGKLLSTFIDSESLKIPYGGKNTLILKNSNLGQEIELSIAPKKK